jgi:hypothetical protein
MYSIYVGKIRKCLCFTLYFENKWKIVLTKCCLSIINAHFLQLFSKIDACLVLNCVQVDDSDDDDPCALSENWTFQPESRRWSRVCDVTAQHVERLQAISG